MGIYGQVDEDDPCKGCVNGSNLENCTQDCEVFKMKQLKKNNIMQKLRKLLRKLFRR